MPPLISSGSPLSWVASSGWEAEATANQWVVFSMTTLSISIHHHFGMRGNGYTPPTVDILIMTSGEILGKSCA